MHTGGDEASFHVVFPRFFRALDQKKARPSLNHLLLSTGAHTRRTLGRHPTLLVGILCLWYSCPQQVVRGTNVDAPLARH